MRSGRIFVPGPEDIVLSEKQQQALHEKLDPRIEALCRQIGTSAIGSVDRSAVKHCEDALLDAVDLLPSPITNRNLQGVIHEVWDQHLVATDSRINLTRRNDALSLAFWSLLNQGELVLDSELRVIKKP